MLILQPYRIYKQEREIHSLHQEFFETTTKDLKLGTGSFLETLKKKDFWQFETNVPIWTAAVSKIAIIQTRSRAVYIVFFNNPVIIQNYLKL